MPELIELLDDPMNNDHTLIFSFINLLFLLASIVGGATLLLGNEFQALAGIVLFIGAQTVFWLMLERGIKQTRYFNLISSFILLGVIGFIIYDDLSIISIHFEIILLLLYLIASILFLAYKPQEFTLVVFLSTLLTLFSCTILVLIYTQSTEEFYNTFMTFSDHLLENPANAFQFLQANDLFIWFIAIFAFIAGQISYFWKRDIEKSSHKIFGSLSSFSVFFLILLSFLSSYIPHPIFTISVFIF